VKKLVIACCAAAVLAVPATAGAGNGYGKEIQQCFGTTYGQAKNAAWASGHAEKPALGAKLTAIAHGCAV
jgi:Na+-translocating ferredoxin:NAD+ oxidoreductase RnfG subunit